MQLLRSPHLLSKRFFVKRLQQSIAFFPWKKCDYCLGRAEILVPPCCSTVLGRSWKKKNNKITEPPNHSDRPFLKRDSLWVAVPLSPTLKMFSSCNGLILKQRQWKITYVIYRTNNACWTVPRAESPRPPLYTRSLRQFPRSVYETRWNHS